MVNSTSSPSFILEFVAAWKDGVHMKECNTRNQRQDRTGIMTELVNTFEKWPKDIAMVKKEARVKIREWLRQRIIGIDWLHQMIILDSIIIKIKGQGRVKTVCIHLCNRVFMFEIKKKQKMSLRTLAAEKISGFITKREDIKKLEVPIDVMDDLNEAFDDCWRVQYNTPDSTLHTRALMELIALNRHIPNGNMAN